MEDDASHHNASEDLLIKHMGRTSNNQPPSLKDAKTPFDIFHVSLLIGDIGALASQYNVEDRGLTQHVEVNLGSCNSKEGMPNPSVEANNGFKDDTFLAFSISVITLPGSLAILSLPVHAVDATNHSWKSSSFGFF
ncbi:hypothetical protein L3X38_008079 [Prunus dulcis]|uniref:Uncharacterized protein n=1 Tax=Prunus dulcis TaxID=3755 RepID=A0AAD4ZVX2_PRUDU|nr:hypothetical protein L3X38_008079 [Prunus dulcis]